MTNWWNSLSGLSGAAQQQGQHTLQGQAMGGQNQAANQYNALSQCNAPKNPYQAHTMQQQAAVGNSTMLTQFEENVPDDELEFEGKLTRWNPYAVLAQYSPGLANKNNHFGIECCQRCLMI